MNYTRVSHEDDARSKIIKGINTVADSVKVTLGPKGKNVLIQRKVGDKEYQHVTKDGVTVAKSIHLEDPLERAGAELIKQAADKTAKMAGDGTTSSTILTQKMVELGDKAIKDGANPMDIKRGIYKATEQVIKEVARLSEEIDPTSEKLYDIATISANNDESIGNLVAEAVSKTGKHGLVNAEVASDGKTRVEFSNGVIVKSGWMEKRMAVHGGNTFSAENPLIFLYDRTINELPPMIPVLEHALKTQRPLIVFCRDAQGGFLSTVMNNITNHGQQFCIVKAPGYGISQEDFFDDMRIATGAKLISDKGGLSLDKIVKGTGNYTDDGAGGKIEIREVDPSIFGSCEKIMVASKATLMTNPSGDRKEIESKCKQLIEISKGDIDEAEKKMIEERAANLSGNIATIKIGGYTEAEIGELADLIDDSIRATKSSLMEGIVTGSGSTLMYASKVLDKTILDVKNEDEQRGVEIVKLACLTPSWQIISNCLKKNEAQKVYDSLKEKKYGTGFNAKSEKVEDLKKSGVIDPALVVRASLQSAASTASMVIMTDCAIIENESK